MKSGSNYLNKDITVVRFVCMYLSNKLLLEFSRYGLRTCYLIYREPVEISTFLRGFGGVYLGTNTVY